MAKERNITHLDKLGRIKLPSAFSKIVEDTSVSEVFVTSVDDRTIQIYPLKAWYEHLDNMHKTKKDDPLLRKFLMKTNYNGQRAKLDKYGRIQIPGFLRKKIRLEGEIAVEGSEDHLELISTQE